MIATITLNPSLDEWITLPTLTIGGLNRSGPVMRYVGGKGINVSRVVHELGGRTRAFGLAGGEDGVILRHGLTGLRVPHHLTDVPGSTRNNYKILTERPRAMTEVNTAGPRAPRAILARVLRGVLSQRPRPAVVVLSGSLPSGVPEGVYAAWVRELRRARLPVVLDASGRALRLGLAARPWGVKPNLEEAAEALGRRLASRRDRIRAVQALRARGIAIAVLSMGADGALWAAEGVDGVWHAKPPKVRVVSAVGAGDSTVAGLLTGWLATRDWRRSVRLAMACGAACAMTPGTELCHRRDVRWLLPRVTMRRVG